MRSQVVVLNCGRIVTVLRLERFDDEGFYGFAELRAAVN